MMYLHMGKTVPKFSLFLGRTFPRNLATHNFGATFVLATPIKQFNTEDTNQNNVIDVVFVSSVLTLNILFGNVLVVDFEHIFVCWEMVF